MLQSTRDRLRRLSSAALTGALLTLGTAAECHVTKIVIDSTTPLTGQDRAYEQVRGRAFGELDPNDPHNAIITDLALGKDDDGKVRYETTFLLTNPVDMGQASGFMWHDVPNRGNAYAVALAERNLGDVVLASGWQADNAGSTGIPSDHTKEAITGSPCPWPRPSTDRSSPATCWGASSIAAGPIRSRST